jgi:hypothetical protein
MLLVAVTVAVLTELLACNELTNPVPDTVNVAVLMEELDCIALVNTIVLALKIFVCVVSDTLTIG